MKTTIGRRRRLIRGVSLLEVTTAAGLSTMLLLSSLYVFLQGSSSWLRGTAKIVANEDAQNAVRAVSQELREAMVVTVDGDGLGLSYRLPQKDGDGAYNVPAVWDGVTRSIKLESGNLVVKASGAPNRILCRKVILTDPQSTGGATAYKIFNAGTGAITRQLTIMIVTQQSEYKTETAKSRCRETIFLRNIPELSR